MDGWMDGWMAMLPNLTLYSHTSGPCVTRKPVHVQHREVARVDQVADCRQVCMHPAYSSS